MPGEEGRADQPRRGHQHRRSIAWAGGDMAGALLLDAPPSSVVPGLHLQRRGNPRKPEEHKDRAARYMHLLDLRMGMATWTWKHA
jgi:hypothetical protein